LQEIAYWLGQGGLAGVCLLLALAWLVCGFAEIYKPDIGTNSLRFNIAHIARGVTGDAQHESVSSLVMLCSERKLVVDARQHGEGKVAFVVPIYSTFTTLKSSVDLFKGQTETLAGMTCSPISEQVRV
jgi:hypothetical protein